MNEVLFCAVIVCVNAGFAAAGIVAARHYSISCRLSRGSGLLAFAGTTALECIAASLQPVEPMRALVIIGFGGAVAGASCDAACGYVFDAITIPCVALLGLASAFSHHLVPFAAGSAAGGAALGTLYVVTRGSGMGLGDVKLACCIGGTMGVVKGIEALAVAFVLAGAYASFLLVRRRARGTDELRFAPYLTIGMAAALMLQGAV